MNYNNMELKKIQLVTEGELIQIAKWRNKSLISLRTCAPTYESVFAQKRWIDKMDIEQDAYFLIYSGRDLVGYCGLDKMGYNRSAEISLLIGQEWQGCGYGSDAVKCLIDYGFCDRGLNLIYGEVYKTTNAIEFWVMNGFKREAELVERKLWNGQFYNSEIIKITFGDYQKLIS